MRPGVTAAAGCRRRHRARAGGSRPRHRPRSRSSAAPSRRRSLRRPRSTSSIADVRPAIRVMLAAVLLLFATVDCQRRHRAARTAARRRREMALRAALGASTARLARQWLTESVVVGVAGGVLGVGGRAAAHRRVAGNPARRLSPADRHHARLARRRWRRRGATAGRDRCLRARPAPASRRLDIIQSLADDGPAPVGAGMRTPAARLRAAIMAGQVAVACVLLIGAVLLGRSLQALINVDRGYDPANLLTARLPLPSGSTFATSAAMFEAIADRMQALPGVTHAVFGNALPLVSAGGMSGFNVRLPRDPSTMAKIQAFHRTVSPGYLTAMGLRLRAGRLLTESDSETSQPVLVVNKSFADQYLGDNPIGRRLSLSLYRQAEWEIVGVVEDMKQGGLETAGFVSTADAAQPEMFSSYRQFGEMRPDSIFFVVRAVADPSALASAVRAIVREQAPTLVLDSVMTMEDRLMSSLSRPRAYAFVLGARRDICARDCCRRSVRRVVVQRGAALPGDRRTDGARCADRGRRRPRTAIGHDHHRRRTGRWPRDRRADGRIAVEDPLRRRSIRSDNVRSGSVGPCARSGCGVRGTGAARGQNRSNSRAAAGVTEAAQPSGITVRRSRPCAASARRNRPPRLAWRWR